MGRNAYLNVDYLIKLSYKFINMFDFTNNYFLSTKSPKVELQSSSPSNYRSKQNKRAVCLYLEKIIKSKINKETSFALGKIML